MKRFLPFLFLLFFLTVSFPGQVRAEYPDYKSIYTPILDDVLELILRGPELHIVQNGEIGIAEALSSRKPSFSLEKIGYTLQDLNADEIPELILGAIDSCDGNTMTGSELYSVYSIQNGAPTLILEGWSRSTWYLLRDGSLLNRGSNGAMYTIFGTYTLMQNDLHCLDYFFTYEKDDRFEDIGIYHNCSGMWAKEVSEELEISVDAFWRLYEDAENQITPIELTPFTAYGMEKGAIGSLVRVQWLKDIPSLPIDFTAYRDSSEGNAEIVFTPIGTISQIKILSLAFQDFDEYGNPTFHSSVVFAQDTLDRPLIAAISLGEVLPAYGISYMDDHGIIHTCTLELSGKDGAILMLEYA